GIDCTSNGSIIIQSSPDNGVTWGSAHVAFNSLLGGLTDKEWTEVDTNPSSPYYNCLYSSWTDFNASETQTRASVAHSCDGGVTRARVAADSPQHIPHPDPFTDPAIGPAGPGAL